MVRTGIRLLLVGIFIVGGWGAMSNPGGRPRKVEAAGIPYPEQAVVLNGALMVPEGSFFVWVSLPGSPRVFSLAA